MPLSPDYEERYSRHMALPEIGEEGQKVLSDSKVAIIGLGGLGSPAALYLAAAGVGRLVIVDHDIVSLSNLHRQIIHKEACLGSSKTSSAREAIRDTNPLCTVTSYETALTEKNATDILSGCDAVIDASDNYATRFVINDAAVALEIPMIHGAIRRFDGQVCIFAPHLGTACYRCLHDDTLKDNHLDESSAEGLLGPLPGIIGSIQALETLKYLAGIESPLLGTMLAIDSIKVEFRKIKLKREPSCSCASIHR